MKFSFLLIIVIAYQNVSAQQKVDVDSIARVIQQMSSDTSKVNLLIKLASKVEKNNPEKALLYSKEAFLLSQQVRYSEGKSKSLNAIGEGFKSLGAFDSALYYFKESSIAATKENNQQLLAIAFKNLGTVFKNQGIYDSAFVYYHKALEIAELRNDLGIRADCLNNIGNVLRNQGNINDAIGYYLQSLALQQQNKNQDGIANATLNLGICYDMLKDHLKAQRYFSDALKIYSLLNDKVGLAKCNNNLAQSLRNQGKLEEAIPFFNETLRLYTELGDKNGVASATFSLAQLNESLGNNEQAFNLSIQSLSLAKENGNLKMQLDIYKFLQKISVHGGNYEQAYNYLSTADTLKDSLFNENKTKIIEELQTKYETEKKEQEIKILDQENRNKELQRNIFLAGTIASLLALTAILFIFIQRQHIAKQRSQIQNQKIQELLKKQEIETYNAMLEGQEAERKRIALDLHDRLGSMLSTVKAYFTAANHRREVNGPSDSKLHEQATALLDQTFDELRKIANNLSTGTITSLGLLPALEDLCDTISRGSSVHCRVLSSNIDERIDSQTEIGVYRITQELLSNALKYAQAKSITVQVNRIDHILQLSVEDDGIGYDYNERIKSRGMGLKNILTRVEKLNGKFHVDSAPGAGAFAFIEIPILTENRNSLQQT